MATEIDPRVERNRAAALSAALEIIFEEGWEAVTQERVAARSGVGRSTVYRHWPDRVVLLVDTIDMVAIPMHREPSGDLRTDLVGEVARFGAMTSTESLGNLLAALTHYSRTDPDIGLARDRMTAHNVAFARSAVQAAIDADGLDPAIDADEAMAQLFGPMVYRVLLSGEPVTQEFAERIVDEFLTIARATTAPRPRSRKGT